VTLADLVGYLAALLVLMAFSMRSTVALRCTAIASNVVFIAYGYLADLFPIVVLHLLLLPLNLRRLSEGKYPANNAAAEKWTDDVRTGAGLRRNRCPCRGCRHSVSIGTSRNRIPDSSVSGRCPARMFTCGEGMISLGMASVLSRSARSLTNSSSVTPSRTWVLLSR
jgi:hypothetical protein